MSQSIVLPALGESVTEGTVTRWLKKVGDRVQVGEPLVEVSTDKVDTEVVSSAEGVIESLLVAEDETVEIGTILATVSGGEPGANPAPAADSTPAPAALSPAIAAPAAVTPAPAPALQRQPATPVLRQERPQREFLSPLVRSLLVGSSLDTKTIAGTGINGRVRRDDVLAALARSETRTRAASGPVLASTLRGTASPMSRLRRVLAERAVASLSTSAQLTTVVEVDVTGVDRLRRQHKDEFRVRTGLSLSFLPFFAVAATEALSQFPVINAHLDGDTIVYPDVEHVNIAVDTERGLLSPVIRNAGALGIEGFARAIDDVATRSRSNTLKPDDLASGTFTITNTGSRGALFDTPVVFLPQVAILGTGVVTRRPVVVTRNDEDQIAVRSMVYLALSYDHRVVDGADAARYLGAVKTRLEAAEFTVTD